MALAPSGRAQTLLPRLDADGLGVRLRSFNLLSGKPLERLKNGQSVAFDFQLQLLDGAKQLARTAERFVISYDLWEENYSIVHLSPSPARTPRIRVDRLKPDAVSTWCLGRLRLPIFQLDKSRPALLLLEVRSTPPRGPSPLRGEGSIDLAALVDLFSRPPSSQELRFTASSSPFTLEALSSVPPNTP